MYLPLGLSIVLLLLAPLFGPWFKRHEGAWQGMDGFVVTVVLGILMLNILPPVMESKNIWAPMLFLLGLALPSLAEQITHSHRTHSLVIIVPAVAIILHAIGDGSLLRLIAHKEETVGVTTGVLLHRAALATAMWWLVVANHGHKLGWLFMALMAVATLLGFSGADFILSFTGEADGPLIQAFAAGSLLHILIHPLDTDAIEKGRGRGLHRVGTIIGLGIILGLIALHFSGHPVTIDTSLGGHDHSQSDALDRMLHFGVGFSPLLLALALAGLWSERLKFLAMISLILWLSAFAILPYSILPYSSVGIWCLVLYALVMAIHFATRGGRSVVAALVPQSSHKHSH